MSKQESNFEKLCQLFSEVFDVSESESKTMMGEFRKRHDGIFDISPRYQLDFW